MDNHVGNFVLKHEDTFIVGKAASSLFDGTETGLFWQGTRFLQSSDLFLVDQPLVALSHSVLDNGRACQIDLCNIAPPDNQKEGFDKGTLYIRRHIELYQNTMIETFRVTSYHLGMGVLSVPLGLKFTTDFYDIFEVRGWQRNMRGVQQAAQITSTDARISYVGLDHIQCTTQATFQPPVDEILAEGVCWHLQLYRGQTVEIRVTTTMGKQFAENDTVAETQHGPSIELPLREIETANTRLNQLFDRGMKDILMLCTTTPHGLFPYAGIPWFSSPFGRDALITSLQFLPWYPEIARGTLAFLAAYQGTKHDAFTEETPGKIIHELRQGEMANCREIAYIPYYGTMDATLLFLIVFESYIRWTNDSTFLEQHWTHIAAAANWIKDYGDSDGDGFVEYLRTSEKGLDNQGWKDAGDSISHADGHLAQGSIALCEVQGYAFACYKAVSYLAGLLGKPTEAAQWQQEAEQLQTLFMEHFWWPEERTCYLALDGAKKPCKVVSSNAGQCLWTGIIPQSYTGAMVARLMESDMYSGWGIRTLSSTAARYNPLSYHSGSVWPHDTALIGAGFARYGHKAETAHLLQSLLDVCQYYEHARLPELLAGTERRNGYGPTFYPVACVPQAWASGAPFMLLAALLGLQPDAEHKRLILHNPTLPAGTDKVELKHLWLGNQEIQLTLENSQTGIHVELTGADDVELLIIINQPAQEHITFADGETQAA